MIRRPPLEKSIERYFIERCQVHGILQLKFISPGRVGVPDRIMHIGGNRSSSARTAYVELKRPGQVPTLQQERMHDIIRSKGVSVFVCDDEDSIDAALGIFLA
jgi:hypothetical protein